MAMTSPLRPAKSRLDARLVEMGAFPSRARAQAAIRAGCVRVNGVVADKPSLNIAEDAAIDVNGDVHDFVSRGGVKLAAALEAFSIDPSGAVCLDLGASTGGFTDILLRAGAARVYAVDVGRDQLHPSIDADPRVVNLQKTHAKDLAPALIPDAIDVVVADVSFISLRKALPSALALAAPGARLAALIKPQFEVGPEGLGKGGLVKPGLGAPAAAAIRQWIDELDDWRVVDMIDSPIVGGDGNAEYLLGARRVGD